MNASEIFSAIMDFFTHGGSAFGKVNEEENRKNAKESVESSELGQQVNELKEALDQAKKKS